jgi:hypothetical protein
MSHHWHTSFRQQDPLVHAFEVFKGWSLSVVAPLGTVWSVWRHGG